MSAKPPRLVALAVPLLAALWLAAPATAAGGGGDKPATLSLTGHAEIATAPDMAIIASGVVSEAKTARAALDANNAAIGEVLKAMREAGIADKDLQTSQFRVEPRYYHPPEDKNGRPPPRIVSYRVSNQLTVRVRALDRLGAILDRSVGLGANQLSGISFTLADDSGPMNEARRQAMADAIAKAELYAAAAGVKLKRILSIGESGAVRPPVPYAARALRAEDAASVPIAAGEVGISADVSVTWEIEQ